MVFEVGFEPALEEVRSWYVGGENRLCKGPGVEGLGDRDRDRDGASSDLSPCFLPPVSTEKTTQVLEEQLAFNSLTSGPCFHVCGP